MKPAVRGWLEELVLNRGTIMPDGHPASNYSPTELRAELIDDPDLDALDRAAIMICYHGATAPLMLPEEAHLLGLGEEIIEACELCEQARTEG